MSFVDFQRGSIDTDFFSANAPLGPSLCQFQRRVGFALVTVEADAEPDGKSGITHPDQVIQSHTGRFEEGIILAAFAQVRLFAD
jgi:hypothetical protein